MKRLSHGFKLLMMAMLFIGITSVVAVTASAEWYVIHGVSGQIGNESALENINRTGKGLACKFKPGANKETWVHFAVPSLKGKGATRKIRVLYYGNGTEVTGLEVYNGGRQEFQMQEGDIPLEWKQKGGHWLPVDLTEDPVDSQNGIGVSVRVRSKDTHPRWFRFSSAQALFDENKTY